MLTKFWVVVAGIFAVLQTVSSPAKADAPPAVTAQVAGPVETVYDWAAGECSNRDTYPDTAARAFRDDRGLVHLVAPHNFFWSMVGPTLDSVKVNCGPGRGHSGGSENPDPSLYDDRAWIESYYTLDGRTVYGLASNEYNAARHPGVITSIDCSDLNRQGCYYYSITAFVSHDEGYNWAYPPGNHIVAELPYTFNPPPDQKTTIGIATASNILSKDGAFYAILGVRGYGAWASGSCLVRTSDLADPGSWRGWDGQGFNTRFINPYTTPAADTLSPPCAPVSKREIRSVVYLPRYRVYIGVTRDWGLDDSGRQVPGFYYMTSPDLVHWSRMRLLMQVPTVAECTITLSYPSILDPTSDSRNFETVDQRPYLYFQRIDRTSCKMTQQRDLVRVPLRIEAAY